MTLGFLLIVLFLLLIALRVPIAFCMLLTSFVYVLVAQKVPGTFIPQAMTSGSTSYLILSIPFFVLLGELMNTAGVTRRLFEFADNLVGHITGGLGHVNVLASVMFAGVSGSAAADAAGLGNVEIKAMKEKGFDADFAVGITAASSTIGPIIPPSTPMVVFGILTGTSIGALFLGGLLVGVLMAIFMMITVYIIARKRNYPKNEKPSSLRQIWKSFREAFWALLSPIILVGGILSGYFTPTEASAVSVVYALFLGFVVYREMTFKSLLGIFKYAIENIGMIMLLLAAGTVFTWMIGEQKVAEKTADFLFGFTDNALMLILLINLFLLFLGTFMETMAAMLISVPVLMPIVFEMGMDPVQFGVIMVFNLMVGLLTPPMGICLFITSKIGGISLERTVKAVSLYYIGLLLVLALISLIPGITLWIPNLFYGS